MHLFVAMPRRLGRSWVARFAMALAFVALALPMSAQSAVPLKAAVAHEPSGRAHSKRKAADAARTVMETPAFPIRTHSGGAFEDGGGADWYVEALISENGRLDIGSDMKAHRSFNGWCGRFAVFLFDRKGNVLGRYGMVEDHSWCVNGRLSPAGMNRRSDELHQTVPAEVLPKIRSVGIQLVTAPTGKFTMSDAKSLAREITTVLRPATGQ